MNIKNLLGPNWAPRTFGAVALTAGVIAADPSLLNHVVSAAAIPAVVGYAKLITALASAGLISTVKGHNVTGGTIAATPEAQERVSHDTSNPPTSSSTIAKVGGAAGAIVVSCLLLGGCVTAPSPKAIATEATVQAEFARWMPVGNQLVIQAINAGLAFAPAGDKAVVANALYEAGQGLYQQMNSLTAPSAANITAAIKAENPTDAIVGMVAASIGGIYTIAAAAIPDLALYQSVVDEFFQALGNDLITAAKPYATVVTGS